MATLHTLNKSADHPCFAQCLNACDNDSGIVLIEDGVCSSVIGSDANQRLQLTRAANIYVLADDLYARGIGELIASNIQPVDYAQLVALCCRYQRVVSWY